MAKIHPQSNTEAGLKFYVLLTPLPKSWGSWGRSEQRVNGYDRVHGQERSGGVTENGTLGQKHWLNWLKGLSGSCTNSASVHQLKVWASVLLGRKHEWMNPLLRVASPGGSIQPCWRTATGHGNSHLGMAAFRWSSRDYGATTQAEVSTLRPMRGWSGLVTQHRCGRAEGLDLAMLSIGKSRAQPWTSSPGS